MTDVAKGCFAIRNIRKVWPNSDGMCPLIGMSARTGRESSGRMKPGGALRQGWKPRQWHITAVKTTIMILNGCAGVTHAPKPRSQAERQDPSDHSLIWADP